MPIMSVLKSDTTQKSPTIVPVSTPFDRTGGWPGAMKDSTVASHVPAWSLRTACSGPGFGISGMPAPGAGLGFFSWAETAAAAAMRATARSVRFAFMRASRWRRLCHTSSGRAPDRSLHHPRPDGPGADLAQPRPQRLEHPLVGADADDGAAGAGELRAHAARARHLDHLDLPGGQRVDRPPQVEVRVHEGGQARGLAFQERDARLRRQACELAHRVHHHLVAAVEAAADVVVEDLRRLAQQRAEGEIERRQPAGIERLVGVGLEPVDKLLALEA